MKILYITNARIPTEKAHGKQIMKMCESLTVAGAQVELVVPQRHNPDFKDVGPFGYYNAQENFKIKFLPSFDWLRLRPLLWNLAFRLQRAGFNRKALDYVKNIKADVVYTRDETLAYVICHSGASAIESRDPIGRPTASLQDDSSRRGPGLYLELHYFSSSVAKVIKRVKDKVAGFIVITKTLKKELLKMEVKKDKILVAPDGVDLEEFGQALSKEEARQQLGLPQEKKICLYAGSLQEWKGVHILAKAGEYLGEDFEVILVGGWPDEAEKFRQGLSKESKARVKVIAHQPPTRIPLYLKAADVLVLPNSGQTKASEFFHTSPLKMFEYMSAGRAIVASDLPVIREILSDDTAVLVEPDNEESLATGIKQAIEEEDQIAERAFEEVKKYTWDSRAHSIVNFIKKKI